MDIADIKGLGFLQNIDFGAWVSNIGKILFFIVIIAIVGGITWWWLAKSKKKDLLNNRVVWFEEIQGQLIPIGEDKAQELIIPNTQIAVFYIPAKNMYLPRPIKKMAKGVYWIAIRSNREMVNFSLKNINEEMSQANLDFDHTDMRYALENLKELIKRNYRDNSKPWWREYKEVITIVIYLFVLTLCFYFIISKTGKLIEASNVGLQKVIESCGSGVQGA